jgi:hypothetical protein
VATAFVTAGGGFLLAVLWFDLMFDVQVIGHRRGGDLPADVLESISAYYARVTTAARPMNRLIAAVMLGMLAALAVQIADDTSRAASWISLALALGPIGLAGSHTVPNAVRLGTRRDDVATRSRLARSVWRDHVLCVAGIAALLVVQLAFLA